MTIVIYETYSMVSWREFNVYAHQNNGDRCSYGTDHVHYKSSFHLQEEKLTHERWP